MRYLLLPAALCAALLLVGCGQTGSLYLPDAPPSAEAEG